MIEVRSDADAPTMAILTMLVAIRTWERAAAKTPF